MSDDRFELDEAFLWNAGAVVLPRAADKFGRAANAVHGTYESEGTAFGGTTSGMRLLKSSWSRARRKVLDEVLIPTANNLTLAGQALVQHAEATAAEDSSTAAQLDEVQEQIENDPVEGNRPPETVTEPPQT